MKCFNSVWKTKQWEKGKWWYHELQKMISLLGYHEGQGQKVMKLTPLLGYHEWQGQKVLKFNKIHLLIPFLDATNAGPERYPNHSLVESSSSSFWSNWILDLLVLEPIPLLQPIGPQTQRSEWRGQAVGWILFTLPMRYRQLAGFVQMLTYFTRNSKCLTRRSKPSIFPILMAALASLNILRPISPMVCWGIPKGSRGIPWITVCNNIPMDTISLAVSTMEMISASADDKAGTSCFLERIWCNTPCRWWWLEKLNPNPKRHHKMKWLPSALQHKDTELLAFSAQNEDAWPTISKMSSCNVQPQD